MTGIQPRFGNIIVKRATLDNSWQGVPLATLKVKLTGEDIADFAPIRVPENAHICEVSGAEYVPDYAPSQVSEDIHRCRVLGLTYVSDFTIQTLARDASPLIIPTPMLRPTPEGKSVAFIDENYAFVDSQIRVLLKRILSKRRSKKKTVDLSPGVDQKKVRAAAHRMLNTMA